jgi:beta-lactamase superfamily II metal-dependent hydrolase
MLAVTRRGALLLLELGNFRALLPVGSDQESMESLLKDRRELPVQVLLLAGGGHTSLNPPAWIERWRPQLSLLSVASGNEESLPPPEAQAALQGVTLLRTDWNGWIEISTDGEKMWVEVERK